MENQKVHNYEIQETRLLDTVLKLVQIDSESRNERAVADYLKDRLETLGYTVKEDNAGTHIGGNAGNVIAYHEGTGTGKSLLFCAHMDTVAPGNGVTPIVEDGVVHSDGTTVLGGDDKAGIAAILEALTVMHENNIAHGPVQVVFTVAEEVGLLGAKHLALEELKPVDAAFFFDSDGMPNKICVASPYHIDLTAKFYGKASHAGVEPEKGISAVQMAAKAISAMQLGRLDEETTANIGIIQGGTATNVVAGETVIYGEARSLVKEKVEAQIQHMKACCTLAAEQLGGSVEVEIEECYAAINLDENSTTVQLAKKAVQRLGLEPELVKTGGGSDANVFCGKGIPATNIGCGMNNVHSVQEYLNLNEVKAASLFILSVVAEAIEE
ncbi:MAG: M20/M25/M40 family metallo-hydrolase [Peptococcaceae bacterium]|jgi:tripeptide aminopeptidase|nr:M20/M25/M40 family metallo-hydrolase [Peptococcaceae bacterium]